MKAKEDSKERSMHHHRLHRNPTVFCLLIMLSYALGYISSPTLNSSKHTPPPPPPYSPNPAIFQHINLPTTQLDNFRVTTRCANSIPQQNTRQLIIDRLFNGISPYSNFPPPHVTQLLRRRRIKGWGSYGAVFSHLINKVKPRVIIEVGTFLGASVLHMSNLTRQLGLDTQILCVDDFRGWPGFRDRFKDIRMINGDVLLYYQFMQNVMYSNASETILPVPYSSGSALAALCEWGVVGDLIEIDAGHDFNSAWADINRAWRILRPGGVIFGHDYFTAADNRGVRRAVNLFAKINGLQVQTDGQHWVIDSAGNE